MAAASSALQALLAHFPTRRVLVAGDVMIDRFVHGVVERISPEAPIPVLNRRREDWMLGGAGNVVANIVSLGATALACSVIGRDAMAERIRAMLARRGVADGGLVGSDGRVTTCKTRFVAQQQQMLRFDEEHVAPLAAPDRAAFVAAFTAAVAGADIVILSDYGKGVLADGVAAELIGLCRAAGKPVLVDPKGRDYGVYRGATAVTPNRKELAEATGLPTSTDAEVEAAGRRLIDGCGFEFVLATRSEEGMSVVGRAATRHMPTKAREVFDVSGAGDTVVAAYALSLAAGADAVRAAEIANAAAGIVVGKHGTAQVSLDELRHDLAAAAAQPLDRAGAARLAASWRAAGLKVGFTNGCFDILHVGHLSQLEDARAQCDRLIVGLNTDASVRRNKGDGRPVNDEADRARLLAALSVVDAVVLFEEDTPLDLITAVRPDVLVKGADYTVEQVVGADVVMAAGGRVHLSPIVPGRSTTETLRRIAAL